MILNLIEKLKESPGLEKESNLYSELVKAGIIPISVNCWLEMYNYFQIQLIVFKEYDDQKSRAYTETSEAFKVSEMTIRRAVKFMNKKE